MGGIERTSRQPSREPRTENRGGADLPGYVSDRIGGTVEGRSPASQNPPRVPTADQILADRLSLTLNSPPTQVRTGSTLRIRGSVTNIGDAPLTLLHDGYLDVLIWQGTPATVVGGTLAWRTGRGLRLTLAIGEMIEVQGNATFTMPQAATEQRHLPRPLPPGGYYLQACIYLYYHHPIADQQMGGWVLSSFVSIRVAS